MTKPFTSTTIDPSAGIGFDDFIADCRSPRFFFLPTMELWVAEAVDGALGKVGKKKASTVLRETRLATQVTWYPGEPVVITDRVLTKMGQWKQVPGALVLNLYETPAPIHGDLAQAEPWLTLAHKLFPHENEINAALDWMAHRVQFPGVKCNHAVILIGEPGIGKDVVLLEPLRRAVGIANYQNISPKTLLEPFNGHLKTVVLCLDELSDLGELNRHTLHNALKTACAAPPYTLRINEKKIQPYNIANVCGVIANSNNPSDCLYVEASDRRYLVLRSPLAPDHLSPERWTEFTNWCERGGFDHIAAYLATRDLSRFNPKAPPPKTAAFHTLVHTNTAPEDDTLVDLIELAARTEPDVLARTMLLAAALTANLPDLTEIEELLLKQNHKRFRHRLVRLGYEVVPNPDAKDNRWPIAGKRETIYARAQLSPTERRQAVREFCRKSANPREKVR
jgi:hypothetical protein